MGRELIRAMKGGLKYWEVLSPVQMAVSVYRFDVFYEDISKSLILRTTINCTYWADCVRQQLRYAINKQLDLSMLAHQYQIL